MKQEFCQSPILGSIIRSIRIENYAVIHAYNTNLNAPMLGRKTESFLVAIFGYGNYSFNKALSGWDRTDLITSICMCQDSEEIQGIALSLYSKIDPRIAIFGPIAVKENLRGIGLGTKLAEKSLEILHGLGTEAVYLGVKEQHPARRLYGCLGFEDYSGTVMRKMFAADQEFESNYFKTSKDTKIRPATWADYPKIQALYCHPCEMKTFDFSNEYFSSKYTPISKFLGIFPELFDKVQSGNTIVNVMTSGKQESIVGIAQGHPPSFQEENTACIDFFIHDNFLPNAKLLLSKTIQETSLTGADQICVHCLKSDSIKREILHDNGFKVYNEIKGNIYLENNYQDTLVYKLEI